MTARLYCPSLTSIGPVPLLESEAHHVLHVLRHACGDSVELFNGQGLVGAATISSVRKQHIVCEVTELQHQPPPATQLTLATAVPKGERFDWLVEKATELGVTRLIPLVTARSSVDPRSSKLDRLRQTVISACKQSRRVWLMELTAAQTWSEFLSHGIDGELYLAHPEAEKSSTTSLATSQNLIFAIGPEGGFTDDEIQSAAARGGKLIGLGENILRIETACIAIAAWNRLRDSYIAG